MTLAQIALKLRNTSTRYGGISHYLAAADALDRACSEFFKSQDLESLGRLNGAVARCQRIVKHLESNAKSAGDSG